MGAFVLFTIILFDKIKILQYDMQVRQNLKGQLNQILDFFTMDINSRAYYKGHCWCPENVYQFPQNGTQFL